MKNKNISPKLYITLQDRSGLYDEPMGFDICIPLKWDLPKLLQKRWYSMHNNQTFCAGPYKTVVHLLTSLDFASEMEKQIWQFFIKSPVEEVQEEGLHHLYIWALSDLFSSLVCKLDRMCPSMFNDLDILKEPKTCYKRNIIISKTVNDNFKFIRTWTLKLTPSQVQTLLYYITEK